MMESDYFGLDGVDASSIRAEKAVARKLRHTAWWHRKTAPGRCHYCGRRVGGNKLTMDHVVPLSRGGKSRKNNLVPCCKDCNTKKKTLLPMEWAEYMDRTGKR